MSWHLVLLSFVLIFPVELPDKTFVASLVLATRYPPLAVWIGVSLAFAVQCVVAVTAGHARVAVPARDRRGPEHGDVPRRRLCADQSAPNATKEEQESGGGVRRAAHRRAQPGLAPHSHRSCSSSLPSGATSRRSSRSTSSPSTATRFRSSSARGQPCSPCRAWPCWLDEFCCATCDSTYCTTSPQRSA